MLPETKLPNVKIDLPIDDARAAYRRPAPPCGDETALSLARALFRERRTREQHLPRTLFAEPAWDLLLELFICRLEERAVQVSAVGLRAGIPATTALRWLDVLEREGLVKKIAAPVDQRVVHVTLTGEAFERMSALFAEDHSRWPWEVQNQQAGAWPGN